MLDGFVRVAAVSPRIRVADVARNAEACREAVEQAAADGAALVVLPELCLTGATCGDLFYSETLLGAAEQALHDLAEGTADLRCAAVVGLPLRIGGKLHNCAAVVSGGEVLGAVTKRLLTAGEGRWFAPGPAEAGFSGEDLLAYGSNLVFSWTDEETGVEHPEFTFAVQVGDEAAAPLPPAVGHALAGATVIANPSAAPALVGSAQAARDLATTTSARLNCAFVRANAGDGESTTDYAFDGQCVVAANGSLLAEGAPFSGAAACCEVDVQLLAGERRRSPFFSADTQDSSSYGMLAFPLPAADTPLSRRPDAFPFIPDDDAERAGRCEEILNIQAHALAERMRAIGCTQAVVGISGGLDSTLALLVSARAFDILGLGRSGITAITMPGFGTTDRTHNNAWQLTLSLGATPREVPIGAAVRQHFADIGHDESVHNAAYENAQARERTQILMDVANDTGGIVVGTGDLSELALGWATYNGDHMSMYAVNAAVPKTLIRYIVRHVAKTCGDDREAEVLLDVLDTPVSPELLPANEDGTIAQQTEDLVGPYELHDFFAYQLLRYGFGARKIYRLACAAFEGTYDEATVLKWLRVFCRRFFSQQFKRSCAPDGPAVGSVGLSPRGGLAMPSDATSALWLAELEELGA